MSERKFNLTEKTGFKINNLSVPVIINDGRGKIFYDTREIKQHQGTFNLPPGNYEIISGIFSSLERPIFYQLNRLPLPERRKDFPGDFDVRFEKNPHKATINWHDKTIIFDSNLRELPAPQLFFILYHEFGHHKYKSETLADAYAENMMLLKGFNPSQIASAPVLSLSPRQYKRKENAVNRLFKRL